MTKPFSHKFAIPESEESEEVKRTRRQQACEHHKFSVICAHCSLTMGSEMTYSEVPHGHHDDVML